MKVYVIISEDGKDAEVFGSESAAENEAKFLAAKSKSKKESKVIEKELR